MLHTAAEGGTATEGDRDRVRVGVRVRVRVRVRVSASLPPAERVSATHMFTVVGSPDMASRPARSVVEILAPSTVVTDHMIAGSTARLTPWIAVCSC